MKYDHSSRRKNGSRAPARMSTKVSNDRAIFLEYMGLPVPGDRRPGWTKDGTMQPWLFKDVLRKQKERVRELQRIPATPMDWDRRQKLRGASQK
jgi:hypothetical protein